MCRRLQPGDDVVFVLLSQDQPQCWRQVPELPGRSVCAGFALWLYEYDEARYRANKSRLHVKQVSERQFLVVLADPGLHARGSGACNLSPAQLAALRQVQTKEQCASLDPAVRRLLVVGDRLLLGFEDEILDMGCATLVELTGATNENVLVSASTLGGIRALRAQVPERTPLRLRSWPLVQLRGFRPVDWTEDSDTGLPCFLEFRGATLGLPWRQRDPRHLVAQTLEFVLQQPVGREVLSSDLVRRGVLLLSDGAQRLMLLSAEFWGISALLADWFLFSVPRRLPDLENLALKTETLAVSPKIKSRVAKFFIYDAVTSSTRPLEQETCERVWLERVAGFHELARQGAAKFPDSRGSQGLFFALNAQLQLQFPDAAEKLDVKSANVCPYDVGANNFIRTLVETGGCVCLCYALFTLAAAEEVELDDAVLLLMLDGHVTVAAVEPRTHREPMLFGSPVVGTPLAAVDSGFAGNADNLRLMKFPDIDFDIDSLVQENLRHRVDTRRVSSIKEAYAQQNYWLPVKSPWPALMELLTFVSFKSARRQAEHRERFARVLAELFELPELPSALELTRGARNERALQAAARGASVQLCAARSAWPANGKILERLVTTVRSFWRV